MPVTLDEIREFLKEEKNAGEFREIVKAIGFETPEETQGLKNKNNEILLKLKKSNENLEAINEKLKLIDILDLDAYIADKSQASDKKKSGEDIKLNPEYRRMEAELKKRTEKELGLESALHATLKEKELSDALEVSGFKTHKLMLKQAFSGKAKIENNDGKYSVVIEDEKGIPVPANEFFKSFAQTEYGKTYLDKPVNQGANTQGFGGSGSGGKTMQRSQFAQIEAASQHSFIKDGGRLTD